ncbi:suppressor of lurcher protein 1 [Wyeomyia smithii]|uniref:suppressor of lurcher protein 1 n=1 Tax=Wyeomyia smithii TaxID=174621 RepID=UPI002467E568|nr:suppressor of lurcher protein 1 [Wyeomyia smithii]XP_055549510.1 suppressor of lurcher protein 1 [Wyeomyia smithii]XP_055549518.1 suppressor of lurcher protein 1 [Wyeomyia smithii]XP_055549527.1 suppressor of lurcher protein 1 [Wyeomyia smithii]XP_055549537.1 suppressor of lurcher protein 1 [Wyeomyia smithii]XP_055549546.1 suppressor of lurcher protein 1 [Wyeomyia smithii]XP_055549553.1 suppressor of lurcher protein 1 [Wyeomyia smithii]XP_055549560.1 suppressor of lurcher protein 1 [Wyeom
MMRQTHHLVKVTNILLYLTLAVPLGTLVDHQQKGEIGVVQASNAETFPGKVEPNGIGAAAGSETSHGKGYHKGSPHCSRLVFNSNRMKNGSVAPSHSKYSGLFPSAICYQYEFIGQGLERIQIVFSEFRLPTKLEPNECGETDILVVVSQRDDRNEVVETLCGDTLPKPILSSGPRMLLEFRSSFNNTENKGFTADFFFLTNFGISTGYQPDPSKCTFHYFKNVTNQGWIQSPNFPGAYPRNIRCNYFFYGDPHDYVLVRFTYFDIEGIASCDESTASDYVEFSNFLTRDRKFALYCGPRRDLIVRSDGRFFRVTMISNDRLDGTGFRALYAFESSISAGMMGGPSGGGGGGNVIGVVGAAGVPYMPQQYYTQTTTGRSVVTVAKVTGGGRHPASSAGRLRSDLHSNVDLLAVLLLVALKTIKQLVTYSTHNHHHHHQLRCWRTMILLL